VDAIDGWISSRSNTSPTAEAFAYLVPPVPIPEPSGA
jgi:hypothetical protein